MNAEQLEKLNDQIEKIAERLGYRVQYIKLGSCGGMVYEHMWLHKDMPIQTADWYAHEYSGLPKFWQDFNTLLSIERKLRRVWERAWKTEDARFATLERRVEILASIL